MIKLNINTETLQKIRHLVGSVNFEFLGFCLDLDSGILNDSLGSNVFERFGDRHIQILSVLLCHYSLANPTAPTGKLLKFSHIPGGSAYQEAFIKRAIEPVADYFGEKPEELPKAAKLLGGSQLEIGDASVVIPALIGIPLTYILWGADEFTASANILYDKSASNYLPTEDLAVLGELTTGRLIEAKGLINKKQHGDY